MLGTWNISHLTELSVFYSQCKFIVTWTYWKHFSCQDPTAGFAKLTISMEGFCQLYPTKCGSDCGLNTSFAFLLQCVAGMSFGGNMYSRSARHKSDRLTFLETPFRVLSGNSIAW